MGLIKFILWVLLIYYFFKLVFQALSKYLLRKVQKQQEMFNQQFGGSANHQNPFQQQAKEGETVIQSNKKTSTSKKPSKDLGEYIDYEEA